MAVDSSSDEDVPLASKVAHVAVKKEEHSLDEKQTTPGPSGGERGRTPARENGKATKKSTPVAKKTPSDRKKKHEEPVKPGKSSNGAKVDGTKKARKVYDMPGQTRDTPGDEDPQRRFYTSLLEQIPSSELAKKWCVMHGLLPLEDAKKWVDKHGKKTVATSSKTKKAPATRAKEPSKKTGSAKASKKKKSSNQPVYKEDPPDSDDEVVPAKKSRVVHKSPKVPAAASGSKFKDAMHFSDSDSDVPLAQKFGK